MKRSKKKTREQPDLILMDLSMPILDGLAATRNIRASETTNNVPIIAVTAHGRECRQQAIEAGCSELINKPVSFDELFSLIEQYLESALNR